jgi:hypothetical protein
LEGRAFTLLGWQLPREPEFTIGAALDHLGALVSELRLASDERDIRGCATAAFDRLEQILRFTVTTWASSLRGADWSHLLEDLTGRRERLTFGDWFRAFSELPSRFAADDRLIGQAGARLRRSKVLPAVEATIAERNRMIHPEEKPEWPSLRDAATSSLETALSRLRAADASEAFPQVLQPLQETRDPFGRITLRLVGHGGRQVEFLMTKPSDLTQPIVVLRGETNPREVDPVSLPAEELIRRAGVGHLTSTQW